MLPILEKNLGRPLSCTEKDRILKGMPGLKQRAKIIPNNFGNTIADMLDACKYSLKKTNSKKNSSKIFI